MRNNAQKPQKPRVISLSKLDSGMEHEIQSEIKFLWKLLKSLLLLPITDSYKLY